MNLIQNTILTSLPAGRKKTPSGWISFNAPCCIHNGETADKKKRGGIMTSADGTISYHCFNCGYKANYVIGRKLNQKMRTFMSYIGIADEKIKRLAIEAMRHEESNTKKVKTFPNSLSFFLLKKNSLNGIFFFLKTFFTALDCALTIELILLLSIVEEKNVKNLFLGPSKYNCRIL